MSVKYSSKARRRKLTTAGDQGEPAGFATRGGFRHFRVSPLHRPRFFLMLKAVFFDAAGTLIFLPRGVGEHYAEVAARFGVTLDSCALERAFRSAWKAMPAREATADGSSRADDDKPWWRELVDRVLAKVLPTAGTGRDFPRDEYFEALYAHFEQPGVWEHYPEVPAVLSALRDRGLALAIVSNFDRRLRRILDGLGSLAFFQRVILSSEVGADKPDPRIFERALTTLGVSPAEALHVGDDPARDWAATRCGIPVFELDRPRNDLRDVLAFVARAT